MSIKLSKSSSEYIRAVANFSLPQNECTVCTWIKFQSLSGRMRPFGLSDNFEWRSEGTTLHNDIGLSGRSGVSSSTLSTNTLYHILTTIIFQLGLRVCI